jgi:SAM-dependent methyltransferase
MNKFKRFFYTSTLAGRFFHTMQYHLKKELSDCQSVLDLGCGSGSPLQFCHIKYSFGVDVFKPYIVQSQKKQIHSRYKLANINNIKPKACSFDAVILINVLEHLQKKHGLSLIKKAEKWAKKKIIIVTPNGFVRQADYDDNKYQKHLSGWQISELKKMGFKNYGLDGLKILGGGKKNRIFLLLSYLTQPIVYYFPKLAFNVFYVKKI